MAALENRWGKEMRMIFAFVARLLRVAVGETEGGAADPLLGVWKLVSYSAKDVDTGEVIHPLGERAFGYLLYTTGQRMSALVTAAGRRAWSGMPGPVEERAEAFSTSTAYMGTYRWEGDRVVHSVDVALNPSWVGIQQVRFTRFEGDRMTLTTPPSPTQPDGKVRVGTLVWERVGS
jgi:hypothetical protein